MDKSYPAAGTAIITGAARGIGYEIARQLGFAGHRVVILDLLEDVHASADSLKGEGLDAHAVQVDVGNEESLLAEAARLRARFDDICILVNNAGISPKHNGFKLATAETSLEEWMRVMSINLTGPFLLCREFLPDLRRARTGRIVNIASVCGRYASALTGSPYNASKTAVITMSRMMANQLIGTSVTVNCVAPGRIITPLSRQYDPSVDREYILKVPVRRLGLPEDIANAVSFLASPEARDITGTVIDVNGGTFCNGV